MTMKLAMMSTTCQLIYVSILLASCSKTRTSRILLPGLVVRKIRPREMIHGQWENVHTVVEEEAMSDHDTELIRA